MSAFKKTTQSIAAQTTENQASNSFPHHEVSFLHCPIQDFEVLADRDLFALVSQLKRLLERDQTLYIHCFGGHGRMGTVVLPLLEMVYGVDRKKAMDILRVSHRVRGCVYNCALKQGMFEGEHQTRQARRMESVMCKPSQTSGLMEQSKQGSQT